MVKFECLIPPPTLHRFLLFGFIVALLEFKLFFVVHAEISSAATSPSYTTTSNSYYLLRRFASMGQSNDDDEDLKLDVPVNIAFNYRQQKRFVLYLNAATPLTLNFSQPVFRQILYNKTINLPRGSKSDEPTILYPCALPGEYDILVESKQRGSIKIEAHGTHPQAANWPLLNRTNRVQIRSQNRVRKRQMLIKWDKSKFDVHAVQYCLVVSLKRRYQHFCEAVNEFMARVPRKNMRYMSDDVMDYIWFKPPERVKRIDPHNTNVICTGSRTKQIIRNLAVNERYYLDVFGVHTKRKNLTFHLASTSVLFNRTHPIALKPNVYKIQKISGINGVQVYSFKIPSILPPKEMTSLNNLNLRYLILPCDASEINVKILKQRKEVGNISGIFHPLYIRLTDVNVSERYIVRFSPSNEDEKFRANRVGLAVTTSNLFHKMAELPQNTTVFEVQTQCTATTIAWYSSPDERPMRYCVIVFDLLRRNRSSVDFTNYCLDFGKRVVQHPQFRSKKCIEKSRSSLPFESYRILNLSPGEVYLVYVTVNLRDSGSKPLPYQTLRVKTRTRCHNEIDDSSIMSY